MTTKDLIEQVRELNEKRTHVDLYMPYCTCGGDGMGGLEFARYKDITESDEKFIALAPAMAEALLEQHRQLQIAREALKHSAAGCLVPPDGGAPNVDDHINNAKQALSEMESE